MRLDWLGAQVEAAAEEEIAIGKEQGFQLWHALGTIHKGAGMLLQGRSTEALPFLLKGFHSFRATGAEVRVPYYLSMLGDAYTQSARFGDALKALNEGLAIAEKNDDRVQEAELHRLKGELLLAESPDQAAAAEDCFRQAIETARRQQSRGWELRATMSLARLWQRQGRRGEARGACRSGQPVLRRRRHVTPDPGTEPSGLLGCQVMILPELPDDEDRGGEQGAGESRLDRLVQRRHRTNPRQGLAQDAELGALDQLSVLPPSRGGDR